MSLKSRLAKVEATRRQQRKARHAIVFGADDGEPVEVNGLVFPSMAEADDYIRREKFDVVIHLGPSDGYDPTRPDG